MGARSSPGAEETIHGPVAYPGRGQGDCETPRVSTRSRTAAVLLPLLLVGPIREEKGGSLCVGRGGVEPPTSRFSGERSYRLSYLPLPVSPPESDPDGTRTRDLRRDRAAR